MQDNREELSMAKRKQDVIGEFLGEVAACEKFEQLQLFKEVTIDSAVGNSDEMNDVLKLFVSIIDNCGELRFGNRWVEMNPMSGKEIIEKFKNTARSAH